MRVARVKGARENRSLQDSEEEDKEQDDNLETYDVRDGLGQGNQCEPQLWIACD